MCTLINIFIVLLY